MARIGGRDLPKNKRVEVALTYIFGIGASTSKKILEKSGVSPDTRVFNLSDNEVASIRREVEKFPIEGELRAVKNRLIKRLMENGCFRGTRHKKHLPVRGQRTKTNARTRKGVRKTVANKKVAPKG